MLSKRLRLPPALSGVLAVLRLLPRVSVSMTLLLVVVVILAGGMPLAFTVVTGLLVGSIPAVVRDGLNSAPGSHAVLLLGIAAALTVGQQVLAPLDAALGTVFGRSVDRHLQERVMAAVDRPAGIAHLEDPAVLNLIHDAQGVGSQDYRPGAAVAALASLTPSWMGAIGSILILVTFHPWLGLLWLLMWPVVLYYLQREYIRVGQVASGEATATRRAGYYRDLALIPGPGKEIRIWGLTDWLVGRFESSWLTAMGPIWAARRPGRTVLLLSTAAVAAVSLLTAVLLVWSARYGSLGLGALAVYVQAAIRAATFRAFDDQNMTLAYAAVSVPAVLELERRTQGSPAGLDSTGLPPTRKVAGLSETGLNETGLLAGDSPRRGIRFEGVHFRYEGSGQVLDGIDLDIPAGRSLAIVGANGAGKTTLIKLLCRLYEPTEGRITVDGVDLADVDPRDWWRHAAAIFQDFVRYHLPARDNIVLGAEPAGSLPGRPSGIGPLENAARQAGALDVVAGLSQGWDTVLSRQYTDGADLSGGQWQRIGLARALFAVERGARVLILDEPTANLDVRAEADLYDRFLDLTAGLTTILVSHRFSTVRRADRIVVLENGRIVESGTHEELLALNGRYARMFRLQAERFVEAGA